MLKCVGSNAYVVDLPDDYGISSKFNVSDLVAYQDPATIPSEPFEPSPTIVSDPTQECLLPPPLQRQCEQIECILDEQVTTMRSGAYQRYLVRWRGRPASDKRYMDHQSRARETGPRLAKALPERSGPLLNRVEFLPPREDWWGHETERAPCSEDHAGVDLARRRLGDLAPASHILFFIFIINCCGHLGFIFFFVLSFFYGDT